MGTVRILPLLPLPLSTKHWLTQPKISTNLPTPIATLFARNRIASVYCLAFGPNGAFVISYKGKQDGADHLRKDM